MVMSAERKLPTGIHPGTREDMGAARKDKRLRSRREVASPSFAPASLPQGSYLRLQHRRAVSGAPPGSSQVLKSLEWFDGRRVSPC